MLTGNAADVRAIAMGRLIDVNLLR